MRGKESVKNLEKAITEFLAQKEIRDFRWITEGERTSDDHFDTCLMIDGDAHIYFWDNYGSEEIYQISKQYGYTIDPINYIDIGFYSIEEFHNR